ncbi:carotenoid ester lipase precursor [Mycena crocata]|nr:carotenoid ester lipase precursor [Mycena crocata]
MLQVPLLLDLSAAVISANAGAPVVALPYGVFRGSFDGNLSTFLGTPFSQPAMRFELPKAPAVLHGVQDATSFGAACPQKALDPLPVPFPSPMYPAISEDCLTLDVFKPHAAGPRSKLPVFVWFYGGGFEAGNSADTDVRPVVERSIVTDDPIIIVTPNYRLNAFGFLGGNEVRNAGISNLGLRDQIFALEWVQKHIAAFGGDPDRVVIGGLSAGAISTAHLLLFNERFNPHTVFRGAFLVSGSPITGGSFADGQPGYDALVAANNCTNSSDTLACLRDVPFDTFMATVNQSGSRIWRPRVDGDVVVRDPLVSVAKELYAKIPIMTGDTDDEGTLFALNANILTNDEFLEYLHSYLPTATKAQIAKLAALYPDDPTQGSPFDTGLANQFTPQFKRIAAFRGDFSFAGPRRFFLKHASKTQNTWSWLSKRGKSMPIMGARHGSDMDIWFPSANATDLFGVDAMINFINTLDPNRSVGARKSTTSASFWPRWNEASPGTDGATSLLTLSDPTAVNVTAEAFREEAIRFLYELLLEGAASEINA